MDSKRQQSRKKKGITESKCNRRARERLNSRMAEYEAIIRRVDARAAAMFNRPGGLDRSC